MSILRTFRSFRHLFIAGLAVMGSAIFGMDVRAQGVETPVDIDPRLVEFTQIIKDRSAARQEVISAPQTENEIYLDLIDQMRTAFYSGDAQAIENARATFAETYIKDSPLDLSQIGYLFGIATEILFEENQIYGASGPFEKFFESGNWFEKYHVLFLEAYIHGTRQERQAALQKAKLALSVIPSKPTSQNGAYIDYAKVKIFGLISHLHNLQGNSELALITSLEYLELTQDNPDLKLEVDLINNLIYSYGIGRNHDAQLYLSQRLLELEKNLSASVPGLSEMRISSAMNSSGRYQEALEYSTRAMELTSHPIVSRVAKVQKSIALAGLGRLTEARRTAQNAEVNLSPAHMLEIETREGDLYLAFLLAQSENPQYATQIYNRQLDVKAQKFLANNSRDTTAMLAELENSRERQAEREAAAEREAQLQAMTIDRQRKINRMLVLLSILLATAMFAAILFSRFRERVLRRLEIKTREAASAEKLKTEFLGMISHELRTPLNGIIGISDFLSNYHEDPDIRQKTGIVLNSGNELLSVVESLTDMARIDAGQLTLMPHDADLKASLSELAVPWEAKARAKGLTFTHFIDPSLSRHHLDEDRLLQCVQILLSNAVSFTESGRVHLHITLSKTAPFHLTVVVADTGSGMTELVQSRLFTPFMQADTSRKREHMGTGLSLAIAYALIEMMEGQLTCMSREGRGSEFKFTIPLKAALGHPTHDVAAESAANPAKALVEPEPAPKPVSEVSLESEQDNFIDLMRPAKDGEIRLHGQPNPARQGPLPRPIKVPEDTAPQDQQSPLRILIVDDLDSNRDILRLALETDGHICKEAIDGKTALQALDRHHFDLVFMDIHMAPMDGIEAIRILRASGKPYANLPVAVLTADGASHVSIEALEAGANLFLTKPIRRHELSAALDALQKTAKLSYSGAAA